MVCTLAWLIIYNVGMNINITNKQSLDFVTAFMESLSIEVCYLTDAILIFQHNSISDVCVCICDSVHDMG